MKKCKLILINFVIPVLMLTACTVSVITPTPSAPVQSQGQVQQVPQPGQLQPGQQPAMPVSPGNNSNGSSPAGTVLVNQTVTVPGGGGNAEVSFTASNGGRIQIVLTASNAGMQPYGNLQYPDGTSRYSPPIDTAANGANQAEIPLNQSGQFTLTVFDGSNQGGSVFVKIVGAK